MVGVLVPFLARPSLVDGIVGGLGVLEAPRVEVWVGGLELVPAAPTLGALGAAGLLDGVLTPFPGIGGGGTPLPEL